MVSCHSDANKVEYSKIRCCRRWNSRWELRLHHHSSAFAKNLFNLTWLQSNLEMSPAARERSVLDKLVRIVCPRRVSSHLSNLKMSFPWQHHVCKAQPSLITSLSLSFSFSLGVSLCSVGVCVVVLILRWQLLAAVVRSQEPGRQFSFASPADRWRPEPKRENTRRRHGNRQSVSNGCRFDCPSPLLLFPLGHTSKYTLPFFYYCYLLPWS